MLSDQAVAAFAAASECPSFAVGVCCRPCCLAVLSEHAVFCVVWFRAVKVHEVRSSVFAGGVHPCCQFRLSLHLLLHQSVRHLLSVFAVVPAVSLCCRNTLSYQRLSGEIVHAWCHTVNVRDV